MLGRRIWCLWARCFSCESSQRGWFLHRSLWRGDWSGPLRLDNRATSTQEAHRWVPCFCHNQAGVSRMKRRKVPRRYSHRTTVLGLLFLYYLQWYHGSEGCNAFLKFPWKSHHCVNCQNKVDRYLTPIVLNWYPTRPALTIPSLTFLPRDSRCILHGFPSYQLLSMVMNNTTYTLFLVEQIMKST